MSGRRYGADHDDDVRMRVIADHVRSSLMLMTDGVAPGNEGRGYILRRLLRRSIRAMRLLGVDAPSFEVLFAASRDARVDTAVAHLGIEFLEVGTDRLVGRMPVDARTRQPFGILHGGASVLLAETLGSVAASLTLPPDRIAVGLDINANHIRSTRSGWVIGTCTPVHVGRTTQVWQIELRDDEGRLTCTSRLTMAVLAR